jgi:hypothetical protein
VSPDGFTVDLDALGAARARVARLADSLTEPPPDAPAAEVFGHGRLADAVNEFAAWDEDARTRLTSETTSVHHGLVETIRAYQQVDEEGADRFGGIA